MYSNRYPRIVISGLSGDSGKTVLSCGLLACYLEMNLDIAAFKKGPDYIDTAWLSLSAAKPARNLDTYLMGFPIVKNSFIKNASRDGINLIEGNRGLFDGFDSAGTHSTAELAKLLNAPVIIIMDVSKVTRTAAAAILGCKYLDKNLNIAGVVLNNVAGERHGKVAKNSIEEITGIPVLGSIPKLSEKFVLPSRHLGLITPEEFEKKYDVLKDFKQVILDNVDVKKILELANDVTGFEYDNKSSDQDAVKSNINIGYFKDQSFSFYYPENLEALQSKGANLIPVSATGSRGLSDLDALYIGGGFPETNLPNLAVNTEMISSLKTCAENGLPVYAECGGLMYLSKSVEWNGSVHSLAGVLPIEIKMNKKPQGHGYCEATVDKSNPFYQVGTSIKGHEFHYSNISNYNSEINSSFSVTRGRGCFDNRDGITYKNVFASYIHIHALATPQWVEGMIKCAKSFKNSKVN